MLPAPLDHGHGAGTFQTHDYSVITWLKPIVVLSR